MGFKWMMGFDPKTRQIRLCKINTNRYAGKRPMTRPAGKDYSKQARGFRDVVPRYPNG